MEIQSRNSIKRKTIICDTNILVTDPNSLFSFTDCEIVLPFTAIEELDKLKSRPNEVGANARETARILAELIDTNEVGALKKGVEIRNNCILKVMSMSDFPLEEKLSKDWDPTNKDNHIIDVCRGLSLQHKEEGLAPPILLTKDILLRVKCDVLGILCEGPKNIQATDTTEHLYTGITSITVDDNIIQQYWETCGTNERDFDFNLKNYTNKELYPNEFIVLNDPKSGDKPILRYRGSELPMKIVKERKAPICNIVPRNKEQNFALDLLMDDSIKLITLTGPAGTGKSLCALAAGLEQVLERKKYKSLFVCRPVVPVGNDIGYLPGNKAEKLEPWIAPIKDNIKYLLFSGGDDRPSGAKGKKSKASEITFQMLVDDGLIEIEAITYLRGRSIANAFIIIDEAQNLTAHELKTIITRVGENTKIVLGGDIEQIDTIYLDAVSNGLSVAVEKFKYQNIAGHVSLTKGERSPLASIASKIL